ncbi:hypothetical protein PPSIR1_16270 [Plesiocystis pacifica SIR-1]|uniref:Uncharacterized protein n=1 Tax=Plesiocystis pacifica SIR-1 TaxID=391625 RepID=A6GJX5_9BACT|nr:hypothetical protein [Plesiocystis pacifica]EDM73834.1 hypothetical protein PPSIR1_16270 [Plesiocystis pacifica SIR-1]
MALALGPGTEFGFASVVAGPEAAPVDPGVHFAPGFPKRDREPLEEALARSLNGACDPPPCVGPSCEADAPILSLALSGEDRMYLLDWALTHPTLDEPLRRQTSCELCSLAEVRLQIAADVGRMCTLLELATAEPASDVGREPGEDSPGPVLVGGSGSGGPEEPPGSGRGWARAAGWAAIGTGAALTITGIALMATNGRPYGQLCSGADVDADGDCRYVLDTLPAGIGFAVAGVALAGGGVGLSVWARQDRRAQARLIGVGVSGSF